MALVCDAGMLGFQALAPPDSVVRFYSGRSIPSALLIDATALFVRSTTQIEVDQLPGSIEFIGTATIGTDHLPIDALKAVGIKTASAPGCNAWAVTDYVLATLKRWAAFRGLDVTTLTLGIIGAGHVGGLLTRRARALGLTCLVSDAPKARQGLCSEHQPIDVVMAQSDVVTVHVPRIDSGPDCTTDLIDSTQLSRLSSGGLLINASRGSVISESTLLSRTDVDLALDVFPDEPYISRPLLERTWQMSPHIAGHSVEGKLNGTQTILKAWSNYTARPLNTLDRQAFLERYATRQAIVDTGPWGDVVAQCPLSPIDQRMRNACMQADHPADAFDKVRKDYILRRESEIPR